MAGMAPHSSPRDSPTARAPSFGTTPTPRSSEGIHKGYFDAGSDFVETNTFGASRLKLNEYEIGDRTRELNDKGARLARSVCPTAGYVAGSIGPTSRLPVEYEPLGDTSDDEYFETFKEQAEALAEGGVDIFAVETMMFPQEAIAAIRACKAATDLPVMATMFFQYEDMHDRDRTMWGESPADVARSLLGAGADIVGMNCGRGPDRAIVIIREMRAVTDAPLIAYPNAGLPITRGGETTYELGPEAMAKDYPALLDAGCNVVGGVLRVGPRAHPPHRRGRSLPPSRGDRGAERPLVPRGRPRHAPDLASTATTCCASKGTSRAWTSRPTDVLALFDEAVALGEQLMKPRVVYRASPVDGQSADLIEAGGARLHIPEIGRLWGPLQAVGAGVCTVGDAIESRVRDLFDERELPLAVMLDSVGSAAVESLAEFANDLLCQRALEERLRATNRISPGYAGWDTAEQKALWTLCPGRADRRHAQRLVLHDAGQEHHLSRRHRSPGARGPLLHPVPALLDARLRLPPRPLPDHRSFVKGCPREIR